MADIFLSYKREDRDKVRPLVEALAAQGWSVWWDTRIGAGETWDRVIEAELAAAKCVVVVWSKLSVESDWVRAEAHEGRERKCLVPIAIEGVTPPSIFKMMQATDLTRWRGNADDLSFSHLCDGIGRIAGSAKGLTLARNEKREAPQARKTEDVGETTSGVIRQRAG